MSNCCLVLDKGNGTCCSGDSNGPHNLKKNYIYKKKIIYIIFF